jgi:hypothetical protein
MVLNWRQRSLVNDPGGPDRANGRLIIGDVWVQMNDSGHPTRFHGRYAYEDGSFRQEILQTSTEVIVTFEPAQAVRVPTGEQMCTQRGPSTPEALRSAAPPFVNDNALQSAGFRSVGRISPTALPSLSESILPSGVPQRVYETPTSFERWEERATSPTGASSTTVLEIAPDGRLIATSSRRTAAHGQFLGSEETWYGPLRAYHPSALPASIFTLTRAGCNGD